MANLIGKAGAQLIRRRFTDISELTTGLYASLVEFLERQGDIRSLPFDAAACPRASLGDLSDEALDEFLARAQKNRGYAIAPGTPLRSALAHLNLLDGDNPSHAAILLFGRAPQRFLPTSEVKCLHFHGTEIRKPIPSHQVYKGTVFALVDQALDFVMSKINRRVGTRSQGPQAPVEYEIPRDAVAEAIVNAVVHRDYASNASVQVMLFSDRLEVWNPGGLIPPLTFEALRGPHPSIPRNPLLAEPMFLARYIERAGTGTLDMAALSREAGLREPQFRFEHGQFIQVLWRLEATAPEVTPQVAPQVAPQVTPQVAPQVASLVKAITGEHTREQLQDLMELSDRENFRLGYLVPAMSAGLVERTIPDRPQSRSQRYRLTPAGHALRQRLLALPPATD
jgi:predicted HTH transcriptional regulator